MPLGTEVGLSPGHIVLDGDPAPYKKPPLFAHVYCGQTSPMSATAELLLTLFCIIVPLG